MPRGLRKDEVHQVYLFIYLLTIFLFIYLFTIYLFIFLFLYLFTIHLQLTRTLIFIIMQFTTKNIAIKSKLIQVCKSAYIVVFT